MFKTFSKRNVNYVVGFFQHSLLHIIIRIPKKYFDIQLIFNNIILYLRKICI